MSGAKTGVLGGTFDPVHSGHLQLASGMRALLGLDTVRVIPNCIPPHRAQPQAATAQRVSMLELALRDQPGLLLDRRELQRDGASYTVDTLSGLRRELGPDVGLYFLLGSDAFAGLDHWHEWQQLLELCNLAVALRPGMGRAELAERCSPALQELLKRSQSDPVELDAAAGEVLVLAGDWPDVSATRVRGQQQVTGIAAVDAYIKSEGLYNP